MKTAALHNLGCKVNTYEMDLMEQNLVAAGYRIVPFEEPADVYIINTCTVTNIADRKSRQMLHRAKSRNPEAVVVAVGCYAEMNRDSLAEDSGVDIVLGNKEKPELVQHLETFFEDKKEFAMDTVLHHVIGHTRAFIKIQDGCNQFCSYCIIPYARGRIESRDAGEVIEEVKGLATDGVQEVVLTGIHLSSFGMDLDGRNNLLQGEAFPCNHLLSLMRELNQIPELSRIRLGSLEPRIITREFLEGLKGIEKFCPHFHLSLQSGSNATLERMNRHYSAEEYAEKAALIREVFEHPALTTDVIVGFPGESEEEFEETRAYLEQLKLYEMHIFPYSMRKGTVAAARKDQVPEPIKKQRSETLFAMEREYSKSFRGEIIGTPCEVLLEERKMIEGQLCDTGFTKEYIRVAIPVSEDSDSAEGMMKTVIPTAFLTDEVLLATLFNS